MRGNYSDNTGISKSQKHDQYFLKIANCVDEKNAKNLDKQVNKVKCILFIDIANVVNLSVCEDTRDNQCGQFSWRLSGGSEASCGTNSTDTTTLPPTTEFEQNFNSSETGI